MSNDAATADVSIDIAEILERIPHRYPFLLVDRAEEYRPNESIVGIKCVTINEPFFTGHFPARPVMPGVLILEALAQAAGLLSFDMMGEAPGDDKVFYFVGIDGARFKRPVEPGDQLILDVELDRIKGGIYKFKGVARVGDSVACEAEIMCTMRTVA